MSESYDYTREKIGNAMRILAIGRGDVRQRLIAAYYSFHTLTIDDFPEELKKDWEWIDRQLTKHGPLYDYKGEIWVGSVENTMGKIRNATGSNIAGKIFDIGWALHSNEENL